MITHTKHLDSEDHLTVSLPWQPELDPHLEDVWRPPRASPAVVSPAELRCF